MNKLIVTLVGVWVVFVLSAQDAHLTQLITDRPDQTESAQVVPLHSLQIETGMLFAKQANIKQFTYNTTLLRYGLLEYIELRLAMEFMGERDELLDVTESGSSPLYLGSKIGLLDEEGCKPQIGLITALVLPFTASNYYQPEHPAARIRFAFSHTLTSHLSLGYNIGIKWDGDTTSPIYVYSVVLGLSPVDRGGMFIEAYGEVTEEDLSTHAIDGGITYLITDNLQVDISSGFGLNDNSIDYFVGFGLSYRLDRE